MKGEIDQIHAIKVPILTEIHARDIIHEARVEKEATLDRDHDQLPQRDRTAKFAITIKTSVIEHIVASPAVIGKTEKKHLFAINKKKTKKTK